MNTGALLTFILFNLCGGTAILREGLPSSDTPVWKLIDAHRGRSPR